MRLAIGGLPGSGTTTLASLLSERLQVPVVSSGEVFRQIAQERGLSLSELGAMCESNPDVDREVDERMRKASESMESGIFEGRLAAHFAAADLRVWLKAPTSVRAERIAQREGVDVKEALALMLERESSEKKRYEQYYGIDIDDLGAYDVVLDSHVFDPLQLTDVVMCCIEVLSLVGR
ncbi:MAG: (d)CMP kinase [Methermicoccaceae archaeon]